MTTKYRLQRQLSFLVGGMVALLLTIGGILLLGLGFQNDRAAAINIQRESACRAADTIASYLREHANLLAVIAAAPADSQPAIIDSVLSVNNEMIEIMILDAAQETVIHRAAPQRRPLLEAQSTWFTATPYFGEVIFLDQDQPYIVAAAPIAQGGVVAARLNFAALWNRVNQIVEGKNGIAYFANSDRIVIGHPNPAIVIAQERLPSNITSRGGIYWGIEGNHVVGATCPIANTTWLAITEIPSTDAFLAPSERRSAIWVGFLLVMVFLTTLLAWRLARLITFPLWQLLVGVRQVSSGNYTYRLNINRPDEIGELARAFDVMAEKLTERNREITDMNQNLEQRIAERTQELQEANRRMEAIAEALYTASERANTANRAKSQFLANMSHELRTPLNAMILYHDLLLRGAYGEINEKQNARLQSSRESAELLLKLIGDVLDLAKIEAGELQIEHIPTDLKPILTQTGNLIEPLLKKVPLEYECEYPPALPTVLGDSKRIQQVILNLLSNAAKFTKEGKITLQAWELETKESQALVGSLPPGNPTLKDGRWVVVVVSDTGLGIPPEMHELIFDEFKQVDDSNTREHGGTGLGLAICKRLVIAMHGQIGLNSQLQAGSQFWFTLPLA